MYYLVRKLVLAGLAGVRFEIPFRTRAGPGKAKVPARALGLCKQSGGKPAAFYQIALTGCQDIP